MGLLSGYVAHEVGLQSTKKGLSIVRAGTRSVLNDNHQGFSLGKRLSNCLPYYYRTLEGIVSDFALGDYALEAILSLATNAPTSDKYRQSHCGEILGSYYLEQEMGFRRLYSKLTMTTSNNTNVHKMDGLFVDISVDPYKFLFVEGKCSILPTEKTKSKSHRSGILSQMIDSLNKYQNEEPRFELTRIRDNLDKSFDSSVAEKIKRALMPPGPENLSFMGVSVTNSSTVNQGDDDFILSEPCDTPFDYKALIVTDLSALASEAYGFWDKIKQAVS